MSEDLPLIVISSFSLRVQVAGSSERRNPRKEADEFLWQETAAE